MGIESEGYCKSCEKLADEIKRLLLEMKQASVAWAEDKRVDAAEIERLHKELQETKNWLRVRTETKWHAEDEVERLHGELAALQTHFDIKAKRGDEKDAEIERLNADYALLTDDYTQVVGDTIRLRAKAEQSRQEIERLQKERDEARGIATRSTLRSERLRKLLCEALNGPGWQDEYWRSAAEEVLGNE